MARNANKIAKLTGATIAGRIPEVGGGAFGAARLAEILRQRLSPGRGVRSGRPSDPQWVKHPKVPMSEQTLHRLQTLAAQLSTPERKISPMQVAAQLLEDSIENFAGT